MGQQVIQGLQSQQNSLMITWTVISPNQFPSGLREIGNAIVEEHAWVAVTS